MQNELSEELLTALKATPNLPQRILTTYVRLWQLEKWLRELVYVELRAKYGDSWDEKLHASSVKQARDNDQSLRHMPGPEEMNISFASFGLLLGAISDEWDLFEPFLPPEAIWKARIDEIKQIRHRVAHFRAGHRDDLNRVLQLLRDLDHSAWTFYASLCSGVDHLPPSNDARDPVIYEFAYLIPWAPARSIRYTGLAKFMALKRILELSILVSARPWGPTYAGTGVVGIPGYIYDVIISFFGQRECDYDSFLNQTRNIHSHVIYILLEPSCSVVRVLLPAVLEQEMLIQTIDRLLEAASQSSRPVGTRDEAWYDQQWTKVQQIADRWPEFVVGPQSPLTIIGMYGDDAKSSIFGV